MSRSETMRPQLATVTLTGADTEYSLTLTNATNVSCQPRTEADVRFAFESGKVAASVAPFVTMRAGSPITTPDGMIWSGTMYFASSDAGTVVEVWYWTK